MIDIIGIDCSTDDKAVAVAVGSATKSGAHVREVVVCGGIVGKAADVIFRQVRPGVATLLAIDAPLGWPSALGRALAKHRAGMVLREESNDLFRRSTDRAVKSIIGQQPLDVGADRIARTAHWALQLLDDVGSRRGTSIPLAWNPADVTDLAAVEVYPAATMKARGITARAYKKPAQRSERENLLGELRSHLTVPSDVSTFLRCADAIDAAACVLAGADFLNGHCLEPPELTLAKQEGWIWVINPTQFDRKPNPRLQPPPREILRRRG
jgi:hypothetical protein